MNSEKERTPSMRPPFRNQPPIASQIRNLRRQAQEVGRFPQIRAFVLLVLAALVIWLNFTFLKPLIMGGVFACVLYPLMERLEPKIKSATLRASLITVLFAVAFLIPIGIMFYLSVDAAVGMLHNFPGLNLSGGHFSPQAMIDMFGLQPWIERLNAISPLNDKQIIQLVSRAAVTGGSYLAGLFQDLLASLPGILFANIIILFTVFFLLIDGRKAVDFIRQNSIFGRRQTEKLIATTASLCYSVVVASIVTAFVQAGLVGFACLIVGVSNIPLILLITFIASFLPVFGTLPVTLGLAIYCFANGDYFGAIVFLVAIGVVGTSDNIVRPVVLKGGAQLHPLVGFVAAFGALDVIGFYGLFIGPIVAGLFFTVLPMVTRSYGQSSRRAA